MYRLAFLLFVLFPAAAFCAGFSVSVPDSSNGFFRNEQVYTACGGQNVSPEVRWQNVPKGAKSLALTVFDPDAPIGHGWMHWVVTDIPANASSLSRGAGSGGKMPSGAVQTLTDFGRAGYGGPCPPKGKPHRYVFTVYAVNKEKLGLTEKTSPAESQAVISKAATGMAQIIVRYGR